MHRRRQGIIGRPAARERGVVIVMTLIAIVLLAGLLFYVMNVGRATNARVVAQNSADAAAAAASGWMARSMNTVAMNNVEMARLIALINVLDAMPLAVDLSVRDATEEDLDDVEALRQAVGAQLRRGVTDSWFRRALESMSFQVAEDNAQLLELDERFRLDPDLVADMTHYNRGGHIWRALFALDDINQSAMENMRAMAQLNALVGGRSNLRGPSGDATALAIVPDIPWQRGRFDDFRRPVQQGLLPAGVDDKQYNRGPFDTLFGWRWTDGSQGGPGSVPGPGAPPLTSAPTEPRPATFYRVYGTQSWMLNHIPYNDYERLRHWVVTLANIKMSYVWPGRPIQTVVDPAWEIDIARDNERSSDRNDKHAWGWAADEPSAIKETLYIVSEIKSRTPNNNGSPGSQGVTWQYIRRPNTPNPFLYYRSGWHDARNGPPMGVRSASPIQYRRVNDHIWRLSATYLTNPNDATLGGDPDIGLPPKRIGTDPDGNPVYEAQTVYWEMDFMLVGVNVGPEIEVRNPYEGFNPDSDAAPAPIDLNHALLAHDNYEARRQYLSVLAIAQQRDKALFWSSRFDAGKPYPHTVAIAQAKVFNNHSWDLWTQMWHAQLEPVSRYDDWVDALSRFPSDGYPDAAQADELNRYLSSIAPLADLLLTH